jgi:hypothetical protein
MEGTALVVTVPFFGGVVAAGLVVEVVVAAWAVDAGAEDETGAAVLREPGTVIWTPYAEQSWTATETAVWKSAGEQAAWMAGASWVRKALLLHTQAISVPQPVV